MGETMHQAFAKRNVIALAAAVVLSVASARAITTTMIPASQDVTLFGGGDATGNNTSSGPGMFVGSDGGSPKRGMIEFDITDSIPAGATITSASLTLTLGMVAGSAGSSDPTLGDGPNARTIQLFDATSPWSGTTLGATGTSNTLSNPFGGTGHGFSPPHTGDSTWNFESFNTTPWKNGPGGDFVSTPSASLTFASDQSIRFNAYTWTSDQMAADVQSWLDGTAANDGWLLKNTQEASQSFRAFFTREGAIEENAPNFQPELTVSFIAAVPEPTSLGLLAIGAPLLLRRRRSSAIDAR